MAPSSTATDIEYSKPLTGRAPTPAESEALTRAVDVLGFAAENTKDLPDAAVTTICTALDAQQANKWDQKIAADFWLAFNSLCTLVKPVTVETLSTNQRVIPPSKWKFWIGKPKPLSLASRSAGRNVYLLVFLLLAVVILSFSASTADRLSTEVQTIIKSGNEVTERMVSEIDALYPVIEDKKFLYVDPKHQEKIAHLQSLLRQQDSLLLQALQKRDVMWRVVTFGLKGRPSAPGFEPAEDIPGLRRAVSGYYYIRAEIESDLGVESVVGGILSYSVLPILLGLLGACAYVVRLISDEIRDTTFSQSSPVRHLVRLALGGLAGIVIGLTGIGSTAKLSAAALAFIAGYAVEPVFATFDSIAEKFRR